MENQPAILVRNASRSVAASVSSSVTDSSTCIGYTATTDPNTVVDLNDFQASVNPTSTSSLNSQVASLVAYVSTSATSPGSSSVTDSSNSADSATTAISSTAVDRKVSAASTSYPGSSNPSVHTTATESTDITAPLTDTDSKASSESSHTIVDFEATMIPTATSGSASDALPRSIGNASPTVGPASVTTAMKNATATPSCTHEPAPGPLPAQGHDNYTRMTYENSRCDLCGKRNRGVLHSCDNCHLKTCKECHLAGNYDAKHNLTNSIILNWTDPDPPRRTTRSKDKPSETPKPDNSIEPVAVSTAEKPRFTVACTIKGSETAQEPAAVTGKKLIVTFAKKLADDSAKKPVRLKKKDDPMAFLKTVHKKVIAKKTGGSNNKRKSGRLSEALAKFASASSVSVSASDPTDTEMTEAGTSDDTTDTDTDIPDAPEASTRSTTASGSLTQTPTKLLDNTDPRDYRMPNMGIFMWRYSRPQGIPLMPNRRQPRDVDLDPWATAEHGLRIEREKKEEAKEAHPCAQTAKRLEKSSAEEGW